MEAETTTTPTRRPPGTLFFAVAMAVYLFVVHGLSLWSLGGTGAVPPLGEHPEIPRYTLSALEWFAAATGQSHVALAFTGIALLYACMLSLFQLTRRLVKGPVWLGSLAGSAFMAHPVKTEVFFEVLGVYYLLATLLAMLTLLAYLLVIERPTVARYLVALAIFAAGTFPFTINAPLFGVLLLLEFYPATPETRQWLRLFPFLAVTTIANGIHMETLYTQFPSIDKMVSPLLLLLYPIGLLPETVDRLSGAPLIAWMWGVFAVALTALAFAAVKNGPFRVCLLAIFTFRFFPGAEPIDFSSLDGGGQLLFPLALGCVGFAGFSRWLMRHEAWGRPTVTLTTMLCAVLFILQFQANRTRLNTETPQTRTPDPVAILLKEITMGDAPCG